MASRFDSDCGSFVCGDAAAAAAADGGCGGGGSFCRFRSTICSEHNAPFGAFYSLRGRSRACQGVRVLVHWEFGSDSCNPWDMVPTRVCPIRLGSLGGCTGAQGEFAKPHLTARGGAS